MQEVDAQLGLFQKVDGLAKNTPTDLIETLADQAWFLDRYTANLQKTLGMGVDEGLVKKLSDGSEESTRYLDAISDIAQGSAVGPITVRVVMPDGRVLAEVVADPLRQRRVRRGGRRRREGVVRCAGGQPRTGPPDPAYRRGHPAVERVQRERKGLLQRVHRRGHRGGLWAHRCGRPPAWVRGRRQRRQGWLR